jgi:hypothetical protein
MLQLYKIMFEEGLILPQSIVCHCDSEAAITTSRAFAIPLHVLDNPGPAEISAPSYDFFHPDQDPLSTLPQWTATTSTTFSWLPSP